MDGQIARSCLRLGTHHVEQSTVFGSSTAVNSITAFRVALQKYSTPRCCSESKAFVSDLLRENAKICKTVFMVYLKKRYIRLMINLKISSQHLFNKCLNESCKLFCLNYDDDAAASDKLF